MSDTGNLGFGEYVKMLRLQKHISLTKAAKAMGMTPQKLNDIESGRRYTKRISLALVTVISKAYGEPIATLIRNTETAVHNDRTIAELLNELTPNVRMTELLAKQALDQAKELSAPFESLSVEILNRVKDIRILVGLMRKRHFNATETSEEP